MFGSLIARAASLAISVSARASAPLPIPIRPNLASLGTPNTIAAPSVATFSLFANDAAASSAPTKSSVSILLVGPASKKSPRVSTSGVVAAISATPNVAISVASKPSDSRAFLAFMALEALTAKPPGVAN